MIEINSKSEFDSVLLENENVIMDFSATWCGPCKMMLPMLEQLSTETPTVKFCKVDVDKNSELSVLYGMSSIPHIFFFKNGVKVHDIKGAQSKPKMVSEIKNYLN